MLLSPSSSLDKRHSSNLHFHSSFKGMLCLISLPCSELLCQAVRKHCGNIQSQTRVHTQSRGHYFCAFPSTRTSWACFEHDFLFVKDFGDPWLKKKNKTALPLQRRLHFPCGTLKETETWGTLTSLCKATEIPAGDSTQKCCNHQIVSPSIMPWSLLVQTFLLLHKEHLSRHKL